MPYIEFNPPNINGLSLKMIPRNSRVLDLGCGDAFLARFMQKQLECKVTGVEINPKSAKIAANRIEKIIIGDLENKNVQKTILKEPKFDVIFASEVLEHLKHPEQVLKTLSTCLKSKKSIIIITLPNVAHWRIRFNLLAGHFEYTKSGILAHDHLKFFTLASAIKFLENGCNLKIEEIKYAYPPVPILYRIFKKLTFMNMVYRVNPAFFAYQIAFKLRLK